MSNFNNCVSAYKAQIDKGEIQTAYAGLVKFVMKLKSGFSKSLGAKYTFGNIFQGYMDFTYFYFTSDFLKSKKLRFGLVLNHEKMRFEIWLLGQNNEVQNYYWDKLKTSKWNKDRDVRPQYSIVEAVLLDNPNFDDLDKLSQNIEIRMIDITDEITHCLR